MPIYEYSCGECKENFEKLVKSMSSEEKIACPKCGSKKTSRTLSVFAVGAEGAKAKPAGLSSGGCGRCGGPGPCPSGF